MHRKDKKLPKHIRHKIISRKIIIIKMLALQLMDSYMVIILKFQIIQKSIHIQYSGVIIHKFKVLNKQMLQDKISHKIYKIKKMIAKIILKLNLLILVKDVVQVFVIHMNSIGNISYWHLAMKFEFLLPLLKSQIPRNQSKLYKAKQKLIEILKKLKKLKTKKLIISIFLKQLDLK